MRFFVFVRGNDFVYCVQIIVYIKNYSVIKLINTMFVQPISTHYLILMDFNSMCLGCYLSAFNFILVRRSLLPSDSNRNAGASSGKG